MKNHIIIILFITLVMYSCNTENGTEPDNIPTHDQALVGTWGLAKSLLNESVVSHEDFANCCVKFEFEAVGTGIVWKDEYGTACGCNAFSWSTKGDQLTIHEQNEYPFVSKYTIQGETIIISYTDMGAVEMHYTKQ